MLDWFDKSDEFLVLCGEENIMAANWSTIAGSIVSIVMGDDDITGGRIEVSTGNVLILSFRTNRRAFDRVHKTLLETQENYIRQIWWKRVGNPGEGAEYSYVLIASWRQTDAPNLDEIRSLVDAEFKPLQ